MVLVDTSVWVEHLRRGEPRLVALLEQGEVLCHPFVVGELACDNLQNRGETLQLLAALPSAAEARSDDVMQFIERHRLQGKGLGWVDMHLLAASAIARAPLWTLDARLASAASGLGVAGA